MKFMMGKSPTAIISFGVLHGGMEMDAFRLAKMLCNSMKVLLIVKKNSVLDTQYREIARSHGIDIASIHFRTFFSFKIIFGVRRIVRIHNIKNVIFFGASEMRSLYFSFIGLNINLIVRHGMKKTTPKKDLLHQLVYRNVNWHVSICKFLLINVRTIIPFGKKAQEKLIYSALRYIPEDLPVPTIRGSSTLRLLHVARIAPDKGQVDAIKACKALYEKNIPFELTCVGEIFPPFESHFRSVVESVPYSKSIYLPGFSSQVPEYLKASDIFIYPSGGEGLSNSFIEALSYGLLCIAYRNTSFPELHDLGFDFLIAEHHNVDDLKRKLLDAVHSLENRKIPIRRNVKLAVKLFNYNRELKEYHEILV